MSEAHTDGQRIAARDALAARIRTLTGSVLAVSAVLSGLFAGIAAASAPGHKLPGKASALRPRSPSRRTTAAAAGRSTAIPPLPAPPGPRKQSAAPPSAPAPAPAPSTTQAPPVVVSGGS